MSHILPMQKRAQSDRGNAMENKWVDLYLMTEEVSSEKIQKKSVKNKSSAMHLT